MATLGELRTAIGERLQDTSFQSISASSVNAIINETIRFYKYRRYWFNETSAVVNCTVGNPVLTGVPSNLLYELQNGGLTIVYANASYPLCKVDTASYDVINIQALGMPDKYTYRAQQFELYPYPNVNYAVTMRYIRDYADLVNDGDSNDFTNIAEKQVLYNALSRIYAEYKMDSNMESYYTARADNEEQNILKRSSALSGTGTLTTETRIFV